MKKTNKKTVQNKSKPKKIIKKKRVKKGTVKKEAVKKEIRQLVEKKRTPIKYFEAIGRRKTSRARVRLFTQGKKKIETNGKSYKDYFSTLELQDIVESPLKIINSLEKFGVSFQAKGGGLHAQAEAVRQGISRALCLLNPYFKKKLRKSGFLTRDSRMRERKKFGLKRARRAPQWSKR